MRVRHRQLSPRTVFLKPRIDYYAVVSTQIREILESFTPLVEPLSLDEAFLDCTGSEPLFGPSAQIGRLIKQRIRTDLRLVASVGVEPNKFLAKIASDQGKPDGFVVVEPDQVQAFLDPLPVGRLWVVGKVTGPVFEQLAIRTIGQLRQLPIATLEEMFGSLGRHYWELAQGIDGRPVVPDREAKSVSHETTFATDIADDEILRAWLVKLVEQVARRLRRHEIQGRSVELKVRQADFTTLTRSLILPRPTNVTQELLDAGLELLNTRLPTRRLPVRLLGFGVHRLGEVGPVQQQLFDQPERERQQELDRVADQIAAKFGKSGLRHGIGLEKKG